MHGSTLNRVEKALGVMCSCGAYLGSKSCRIHNDDLLADVIEAKVQKPTDDEVARLQQLATDLGKDNAELEKKNEILEGHLEDMRRPFTERLLALVENGLDRIIAVQLRMADAAERQAIAAEIRLRSGK